MNQSTITIEAKGVDAAVSPNCLHILIASNEEHVVPASGFERRFVIMQADDSRMQDKNYFSQRQKELDDGGLENLLHYLLTLDISDFDHRAAPRTAALSEQAELSMTPLDRWLFTLLDEARLPNNIGGANIAATQSGPGRVGLLEDIREREPCFPQIGSKKLTNYIKRYGCVPAHLDYFRGWHFPPLSEMRIKFEEEHGPQRWSDNRMTNWLSRGHPPSTPF